MEPFCPLCRHVLPNATGAYINDEENAIILDNMSVKGTPRGREILRLLIDKSPRTVSRGFMMDAVYGMENGDEEPDEKIIDVHICRIRKDIKESNYEIITICGKGFLFRRKVAYGETENWVVGQN